MTFLVLTNVRAFQGGCDFTGVGNKVAFGSEVEEKDTTTFGSEGWKEVIGGLIETDVTSEGYWEAGDSSKVDDRLWADLAGLQAYSVGPSGATVGELAYLTKLLQSSYSLLGQVGDVAPWSAKGKGSWPVVKGVWAHPPGTARTSTATGTAVELGAVAAGQRLYAALHVLSVSGTDTPTITCRVESDAADTFGSATTQLTFTAATGITGQILRTAGSAITDTWYRFGWTISGTDPSFLFAATFGVR